jgi:hypothetical protein
MVRVGWQGTKGKGIHAVFVQQLYSAHLMAMCELKVTVLACI